MCLDVRPLPEHIVCSRIPPVTVVQSFLTPPLLFARIFDSVCITFMGFSAQAPLLIGVAPVNLHDLP
jgi:hypothetical protein